MKQQYKGEILLMKKCINRILRFYYLASANETIEGLNWYKAANEYSHELAARFNISLQQAVGIIAVFSPQAGWLENKRYAVSFLISPKNRLRSLVQHIKAKKILKMKDEATIYHSLTSDKFFKSKAFFLNILNPDLVTSVTIDRHAIAICLQDVNNTFPLERTYGKLTKNQYEFFERCYVHAANEVGLLPQQLQAIVWVTYRRIRNLKQDQSTNHWQPFETDITF